MQQSESSVATISVKDVSSLPGSENGRHAVPSKAVEKADKTPLDDALTLTESGWFHHIVLLCSGIVFLACGLQNGLNAYILPSCKCDFDLSSGQMGMLNALFLGGGMSSAYLNGFIADTFGRKLAIVGALVGDSICSLCAAMSPNFAVLGIFRFMSGFLSGGPAAIIFLYLSEYLPQIRRPACMLLVGLFWTISWLLLPAFSWIILPTTWPLHLPIPVSPWRIFVAFMIIPDLTAAFLIHRLPEAPQYLHARGRSGEALVVLAKMFSQNTGKKESEYSVKALVPPAEVAEPDLGLPPSKSAFAEAVRSLRLQLMAMFKPPVLSRTLIAFSASFFNMFCYYGLALWLPELLSRFQAHYELNPNRTVSVCELTRLYPIELAASIAARNSTGGQLEEFDVEAACNHAAVNEDVFIETLIISAVALVGGVISVLVAPHVGRRTIPVFLNAASAALVVAVYFVSSNVAVLVVASLFQAFMSTCNTALNGLIVDLFPPQVSALGVVSAILAGRMGAAISNIALGTLIDIACEVPISMLALSAAISAVLCVFFQRPWGECKDEVKEYNRRRSSAVVP